MNAWVGFGDITSNNKKTFDTLALKHKKRLEEVTDNEVFGEDASKEQIIDVLEANERIKAYKKEGQKIVIVNATWDLLHPCHVSYLKIIERKLQAELWWGVGSYKLVCGLEHEDRVRKRKSADRPILPVALRRYMLENQKQVDDTWVYPDLIDDRCPSDVCMMFAPDVLIMHEEHMKTSDKIERLKSKMASVLTDLLLITKEDDHKYLGYDLRDIGVSTSKIVERIKKWWDCEEYFKTEYRIHEKDL